MRATINFEADVGRVQQIMWALAFQEMDPLHQAMDFVETAKPHELHEGITNALDLIHGVATQLEQYRAMLISFEKARFDTVVPQSADKSINNIVDNMSEVKQAAKTMENFDNFLSKINEGGQDETEPKEG